MGVGVGVGLGLGSGLGLGLGLGLGQRDPIELSRDVAARSLPPPGPPRPCASVPG